MLVDTRQAVWIWSQLLWMDTPGQGYGISQVFKAMDFKYQANSLDKPTDLDGYPTTRIWVITALIWNEHTMWNIINYIIKNNTHKYFIYTQ